MGLLNAGHKMNDVYSKTQGYPSDEDILSLFSALNPDGMPGAAPKGGPVADAPLDKKATQRAVKEKLEAQQKKREEQLALMTEDAGMVTRGGGSGPNGGVRIARHGRQGSSTSGVTRGRRHARMDLAHDALGENAYGPTPAQRKGAPKMHDSAGPKHGARRATKKVGVGGGERRGFGDHAHKPLFIPPPPPPP